MKTKNCMKHVCSLLLIFVLIFTSIPLNAIAQEANGDEHVDLSIAEEDETIQSTTNNSQNSEKDSITQKEIVDLRTENTKHFDMGDGTYQAVTYSYPVHRKDASGKWQEIDNTLSAQKISTTTMYATDDLRVKFASEFSSSASLVTLNENGYIIDMSFVSPGKGVVSVASVNNSKARNELITANRVSENIDDPSNYNSTSTIKYKNVGTNVDLEYVLYSNDVKENIIVNGKCADYTYTFRIKLNNLAAELDDSGIVYFRDLLTNDVKYLIPLPYMYDADGNVSYNVVYQLKEVDADTYELTIVADSTWINSTERVFPVVIDPTISSTTGFTYDTYVNATDSTTKDTNYGYEPTMWISNLYRTTFVKSTLMPSLPSGATITDARLKIAYYYYSGVTGGMYITAHQVTKNWWETYSWNDMSNNGQDTSLGISSTALSTTYLGASSSYPRWASINVTNAVKSWYNGGTSASNKNYGVALKYKSGNTSVIFHSYDAENDYTPYFTVTYKIPNGVYAIEKANTDVYVKNNTIDALAWVFQDPLNSPPVSKTDRDYLFKITYRPTTDDYVIRSMSNNEIIIYPSVYNNAPVAGRITVSGSPATDSNLPTTRTWKMTTTSDGYDYIWYKEDGVTYYMRSTSNEGGGPILGFTTNPSDTGTKWSFHKYSGAAIDGVSKSSYSDVLMLGETFDYDVYMYSSTIGRNGPIIYSVSEPDYSPTDKATIDSSTGVLTALKPGIFRVKWTYSGSPLIWSRLVEVCFETGLSYTIKNVSTGKLIKPTTTSNNSTVQTGSYSGTDSSFLWVLEYDSNGYYKIRNETTGYYLTAPSNNNENAEIKQSTYNSTYGLWKIQRIGTRFIIQSKNQYLRSTSTPLYLTVVNDKIVQSSTTTYYKWDINALTLNLKLYYDQAFKDSYAAIGIEAVDAIDYVVNHNTSGSTNYRSVVQFFKEEFGIRVNTSIVSDVYESYPYENNCQHMNSPGVECHNCKNVSISGYADLDYCKNGYHHKSANKIVECTPASNSSINIVFTGHKATCGYDGTSHTPKTGVLGRAEGVGSGNRCAMFLPVFSDKTNYDSLKITFTHEILHLLDVSHHYNSGTTDCVHGKDRHYSKVYMPILICSRCVGIVDSYKLRVLYAHNS